MAGASPVAFRRIDLALGIHKAAQKISVFVVDLFDLVLAEKTGLLLVFLRIIVIDISHIILRVTQIVERISLSLGTICGLRYAMRVMRYAILKRDVFDPDLVLFFIEVDGRNFFFG